LFIAGSTDIRGLWVPATISTALLTGSAHGSASSSPFQLPGPQFLTASLLPVLVGSAWGAQAAGRLDYSALLLASLATLLVHAASNVYNDVSDEEHDTDRANTTGISPFTAGSRLITTRRH
jgi:1,4-dihydroxy-2-naphthoate octaprenyltransferase